MWTSAGVDVVNRHIGIPCTRMPCPLTANARARRIVEGIWNLVLIFVVGAVFCAGGSFLSPKDYTDFILRINLGQETIIDTLWTHFFSAFADMQLSSFHLQ
ncbi:hypothetical protein I7I48_10701 [Histoplasma ohiense]|nr:hypothetical protein I7I48_10701 [Histoplasma ohiense (nom. inval.)]